MTTKTMAVPADLLRLMRNGIECGNLHHKPSEYHAATDPCPVLERIDAILSAPVVDEPESYPNTGSAGQSIARCSQSHSEAGWCGTDDCYRRNR